MPTSRLARVFWRLTGRWRHQRRGRRGRLLDTGIRLSRGGLSEPQPVQGPRLVLEAQAPHWVQVDDALALKARPACPSRRPPVGSSVGVPQLAELGPAIASVLDEMAQELEQVTL